MAKPIIVEGKTVLVPDDATPEEMLQIANEHAAPSPAPAEKPMSFAEKAKDIAKSGVTGLSEGVAGLVGLVCAGICCIETVVLLAHHMIST